HREVEFRAAEMARIPGGGIERTHRSDAIGAKYSGVDFTRSPNVAKLESPIAVGWYRGLVFPRR
ncbi:MAG: hypothetical protein ABI680_10310, partial [Chthoniobacteraceae bacterium]